MKITRKPYGGLDAVWLENDILRLIILPELGAKLASLSYKPQRFQALSLPGNGRYRPAEYGALFEQYDCSGADDCFPSIEACEYPYRNYTGKAIPDHGELWSLPWSVEESESRKDPGIHCEVDGRALPYSFAREISLKDNVIRLDYEVYNSGNGPLYGLWAFHALWACDSETRLELPGVREVVNVHESKLLGPAGSVQLYPTTVNNYPLDQISPPSAHKTEKYYVNHELSLGQAGLTLNRNRLRSTIRFPAKKLPYLGVWLNEGGFKNSYNLALEPSNGFYDSLERTAKWRTLKPIPTGKSLKWWLEIELSEIEREL